MIYSASLLIAPRARFGSGSEEKGIYFQISLYPK